MTTPTRVGPGLPKSNKGPWIQDKRNKTRVGTIIE